MKKKIIKNLTDYFIQNAFSSENIKKVEIEIRPYGYPYKSDIRVLVVYYYINKQRYGVICPMIKEYFEKFKKSELKRKLKKSIREVTL